MRQQSEFFSRQILFGACLLVTMAHAEALDLATPEGVMAANRRIQCAEADGKPSWFVWEGDAYSRRQGEPDQRLFKVLGMNVRQCVSVDGARKGRGYRMVSREIMLYLDPKEGKPLLRWFNPWLGREVSVMQVENDPVNQAAQFPYRDDGSVQAVWRGKQWGGLWQQTLTIPLYYQNVLQGDYQPYVGGAYHATEMFDFSGDVATLTADGPVDHLPVSVAWVRLSDWLPWMEMSGREGNLYIHASGVKLASYEALPETLRHYIETHAPLYRTPPAGDDSRPNETSWTVFKARVPGRSFK